MRMEVDTADLRRLAAKVGRAQPEIKREIAKENRSEGKRVRDAARRRMAGLPYPKASTASTGIDHRAYPDKIELRLRASNPFVRALEFGTIVHYVYGRPVLASSMRRRVFAPHSGDGYALRPTVESERDNVAEQMVGAVIRGLNKAL
jgi:hypothetical protein